MDGRKKFLKLLGFSPKNNSEETYQKKYQKNRDYLIDVDFKKKLINYGPKIRFESKTTQNLSQEENWVVLECVDRLLEKGYSPEDLILEKVYPTGHGTSGRLDILVMRNKRAYLMIECKTFGNEFQKELKNLHKNGGQLFTYFQQDRDVENLVLYSSCQEGRKIIYVNEIVKIEEEYRETGNVKDLYERWSKISSKNGIFESWTLAYEFKNKALTLGDLKSISQEDSGFIFNRFLEILRHNVVSDKPNAFNKIFTLFLCKIIDEDRASKEQLAFQWIEGIDNNISFQKRLTDLYRRGMKELLSKEVTDISDKEFNNKYASLDDKVREKILDEITKIRLQKNNEFAIKEVFDEISFEENGRVLKEVVQLLQGYKIRYAEKQQYLGDFFELLLTTGLKQESGQFFTPVPIARFICRSIPLDDIVKLKIQNGNSDDLLPNIIDYAAGSGHFLTEAMGEVQRIIQDLKDPDLKSKVKKTVSTWKVDPFSWAYNYIYGIEKDYRLVKTAKVGCYLHGDGISQVIHGDGLGNFIHTKEYRNKLNKWDNEFIQDNGQFDIVISNPPYSVSAFKTNLKRELAEKDFELYKYLTDQSSEIECLFIERTKQLLKEGGIAGIILPSSILSNTGIYTKAREILLKYFEIVAITELGSNTFMATGTNTVTLFLRRRNNYEWLNIRKSIEKFSNDFKDISVNQIEKVFSKYVNSVWVDITFNDYASIFKKSPNQAILDHEIYKEYQKIKLSKNEKLIERVIRLEMDKLLYFILTYSKKIVLVKSKEKNIEKSFLGYEFSNRRGSEGIHPIQRGKSIDECTKLFDPALLDNPKKASTYILNSFNNNLIKDIDEELKDHISIIDLNDLLTFDRNTFEKNINLNVKKKVNFNQIWGYKELVPLSEVSDIEKGRSITKETVVNGNIPVVAGGQNPAYYHNKSNRKGNIITCSASGAYAGFINYFDKPIFASDSNTIKSKNEGKISTKLIYYFLKYIQKEIYTLQKGQAQPHVYGEDLSKIQIPIPPKKIQEKIVEELEVLKKREEQSKNKINQLDKNIKQIVSNNSESEKLDNIKLMLSRGKSPKYGTSNIQIIKSGQARGYKEFNFAEKYYVDENFILDERKLEKGDILINSSGVGTAGRVTLFNLDGEFVVDSHISILRIDKNKANPDYILYSLANIGFKTIEAMAMGQSGQIELSQTTIKNIKIPLPSISEQNKIVKEIEKIESEISKLKKEINEVPKLKENILNKYLR
jgi:type I restriction enzyme M protein